MCDLDKERRGIDSTFGWAAMREPVRNSIDEDELAGFALAVLQGHYADACPDECLRKRCEEFANRLVRIRKSEIACDVVPISA